MKLHRYILARFKPDLTKDWENRAADSAGVRVRLHRSKDAPPGKTAAWRLLSASVELEYLPDLDAERRILIPEGPRRRCEFTGEHFINLASVFESASKAIASPNLCVALEPSDDIEREFLTATQGILPQTNPSEFGVDARFDWTPELGRALEDRADGVALLSEAFSAGSEGGQYREFVRFLELAFAAPFYDKRMKRLLRDYFGKVPAFGYSAAETEEWVKWRAPAMHADLRKTKWIALTADVRHVVLRMRQACLDVLFNKQDWKKPSSDRRNIWLPSAITTSPRGHAIARQGSKPRFLFRVLDEFGVYPRIIEVSVDHSGDGYYATYSKQELPDLKPQASSFA